MTIYTETDGEWTYTQDEYKDWRGTNDAAGLRTRLKSTLEWAKRDVQIGRLQRSLSNGEWIDDIRG